MQDGHSHYLNLKVFDGGDVKLFHRPDTNHRRYYCAVRVPPPRYWLTRSTKTTDESKALNFARRLMFESERRVEAGLPLTSKTIQQLFDDWLIHAEGLVRRGHRWTGYATKNATRWRSNLQGHFAKLEVAKLTQKSVDSYWDKRIRANPAIKFSTLEADSALLGVVLRYAAKQGHLSRHRIPDLVPPEAGKKVHDPSLPVEVARMLIGGTGDWMYMQGKFEKPAKIRTRRNLYYRARVATWALFALGCGARPQDMHELRWKHFRKVPRDIGPKELPQGPFRLEVHLCGKNKPRDTQLHEFAAAALSIWEPMARHRGPDGFVFANWDGSRPVTASMNNLFQTMMSDLGHATDDQGRPYTLYSLRHTHAKLAILYSNSFDLTLTAKNMGTSTKEFERTYLAELELRRSHHRLTDWNWDWS